MSSKLKLLGKILKYLIWWILYAALLLTASSFLIPFAIWKIIVVGYVRTFKSNIGDTLTGYDTMFALEDFYDTTYATNVKIIILEENLNIDTVRNGFIANVLSVVNEENQPQFDKLYQIPITIGGYYFWKRTTLDVYHQIREDRSFTFSSDPNNHENEFNMLMGELMAMPFRKDTPIWEIILYRGYRSTQSILVFRFHHSLGDGYSFNHLIDRLIQKTSKYTVKNQIPKCCSKANLVFTAPKRVGDLITSNYVHSDYYTQRKMNTHGLVSMTTIPLETMKKIRRVTKTHFATVGMSLLAGALRRCFLERNLPGPAMPNYVSVMHSLPKPNHPITKMVNHWGVGFFRIPMKPANALRRLYQSERNFSKYISEQYEEIIQGHIIPMVTILPSPMLELIFALNFGTAVGFTSIPAFEKEAFLFGQHKIQDIYKIFGLQWRQSAVTSAIYSHNGKVSFAIYANKDIIPDQATMDRVTKQYLHEELQDLLQQCRITSSSTANNNSLVAAPKPTACSPVTLATSTFVVIEKPE